jgi:beta-phosphoglucomutase-like phosphatase (HAD superfamily)
MHLVMFDIDGTLVDSAGFEGDFYAQAIESVLGVRIDRNWDVYEHVSDSGILAQVLREAEVDGDCAELAARVQRLFVAEVSTYLANNPSALREIEGAKCLVERLLVRPGVRVAVATGGWQETARLKLRLVGIDSECLAFASSSDAQARTEIMQLAARRAMQGIAFRRATYFGDGPWDRRASEQLGYDFVAVGKAVAHNVAYDDLRDTDAILTWLEASNG